jgi:hypothetical protein
MTKFTRRDLAAAALAASLASAQTAQTTPTPEEELTAARGRLGRAQGLMDKVELPMSTEPAVQFRA